MPREEPDNLLDDLLRHARAFEIVIDKLIFAHKIRRKSLIFDLKAIQLN